MEYIEIWDESLQIEFANSFYKCFNFEKDNYNSEEFQDKLMKVYFMMLDIINPLLKFFMKIISTDDHNVYNILFTLGI